jgi:hypothetical protein
MKAWTDARIVARVGIKAMSTITWVRTMFGTSIAMKWKHSGKSVVIFRKVEEEGSTQRRIPTLVM